MWCYVDIVILSCGGAHTFIVVAVDEITSVVLNDVVNNFVTDFFKANQIQCCSFDNSYSLHRCHLALLKVILCVVSPLLLASIGMITYFMEAGDPLVDNLVFVRWIFGYFIIVISSEYILCCYSSICVNSDCSFIASY